MRRHIKKSVVGLRRKFHGDVLGQLDRANQKIEAIKEQQTSFVAGTNQKLRNSGSIQVGTNEILTKIFTGLKMYLDPRDMAVAAHIALDGIWEEEITKAWLSIIEPEFTVLDIGANFGYFGLLAAQFTNKKSAKVVLFEANPNIIPYLNKSLSINWFNEQTVVENFAVADKKGLLKLSVLDNYIGSSSVQSLKDLDAYMHDKMQLNINQVIEVPATTIDAYCEEKSIQSVDLIKMDIEGYEEKAYQGMREMIKKSPMVTMFIEFTKDGYQNPRKFYEQMLRDFGNVYSINPDGSLTKIKKPDYDVVIGEADDWVMPVFSKRANLERLEKKV